MTYTRAIKDRRTIRIGARLEGYSKIRKGISERK